MALPPANFAGFVDKAIMAYSRACGIARGVVVLVRGVHVPSPEVLCFATMLANFLANFLAT